jgi:TRAP-type C4-dicarboxylate transport system permease small subunit
VSALVPRSTRIWLVIGAAVLLAAVIAMVLWGGGSGPGTGGGY